LEQIRKGIIFITAFHSCAAINAAQDFFFELDGRYGLELMNRSGIAIGATLD